MILQFLGGLAAGIAGNAFGAATYAKYEMQNEQIREANNQSLNETRKAASKAYLDAQRANRSRDDKLRESIDKYEDMIAEVQCAIVENPDYETIMSNMRITRQNITISETGTVRVSVTLEPAGKVFVVDDVPAVIDGTLIAKIFHNDSFIGNANLVFPFNGLNTEIKLKGICLKCASNSNLNEYHIEFSTEKLCYIEKNVQLA